LKPPVQELFLSAVFPEPESSFLIMSSKYKKILTGKMGLLCPIKQLFSFVWVMPWHDPTHI